MGSQEYVTDEDGTSLTPASRPARGACWEMKSHDWLMQRIIGLLGKSQGWTPDLMPENMKSCRGAWLGNSAYVFLFVGKTMCQAKLSKCFLTRVIFSSSYGYVLYIQISFLFSLTFSLINKDGLFLILLCCHTKRAYTVSNKWRVCAFSPTSFTWDQTKLCARKICLQESLNCLYTSLLYKRRAAWKIKCLLQLHTGRDSSKSESAIKSKVSWVVQHLLQVT